METTFMTIHNLTPEANILFASESIVDVLGYAPYEVIGKSCFEYFHPGEVPFAKYQHERSIRLDKASVLYYARVQARDGGWVGCECVFSVVHDVLVACTSVYRQGLKSERRAIEAPQIRRLFASSPRDPRYHMLEHLSSRFRTGPSPSLREPRAALILNRFSRTLSIMFATNAVFEILGVTAQELTHKSFYECIAENCLPDAIRSLESAKANDSIAYLRFTYHDPRLAADVDQLEHDASHSSDSEDGGVPIDMDAPMADFLPNESHSSDTDHPMHSQSPDSESAPRTDSGGSTDPEENFNHGAWPAPRLHERSARHTPARPVPALELEAVVSCTSDGLVVILRRARPCINSIPIFVAPWGTQTILPEKEISGPRAFDFMSSIREVAVFAWSLTGINGKIAAYSHGVPRGEAVPPRGFPVWDAQSQGDNELMPHNQAQMKWEDWERDGRVGSGGYDRVQGWREGAGWGYEYPYEPGYEQNIEPGSLDNSPYQHQHGIQEDMWGQQGGRPHERIGNADSGYMEGVGAAPQPHMVKANIYAQTENPLDYQWQSPALAQNNLHEEEARKRIAREGTGSVTLGYTDPNITSQPPAHEEIGGVDEYSQGNQAEYHWQDQTQSAQQPYPRQDPHLKGSFYNAIESGNIEVAATAAPEYVWQPQAASQTPREIYQPQNKRQGDFEHETMVTASGHVDTSAVAQQQSGIGGASGYVAAPIQWQGQNQHHVQAQEHVQGIAEQQPLHDAKVHQWQDEQPEKGVDTAADTLAIIAAHAGEGAAVGDDSNGDNNHTGTTSGGGGSQVGDRSMWY